MIKFLTSALLVLITGASFGQQSPVFTWAEATSTAPVDINPIYARQSVAAWKDKSLTGTILNNQIVVDRQMGDHRFAELDTNGSVLASTTVVGKLSVIMMAADAIGNWYILGNYADSLKFPGGNTFTRSFSGSEYCLFRLNAANLSLAWFKSVGSDFQCTASAMEVRNGQVFVPIDSATGTAVVKFAAVDGSRTDLWRQEGHSWTTSIMVDSKENIYLVGTCAFNGIDFNGHVVSLPSMFQYPQYIVRYKSNGLYDWSKFMQDGTCFAREFHLAGDNMIYYSGPLNDTLTLGAHHLTQAQSMFSFMVARMDSTGQFNWARQVEDSSTGIALTTDSRHTTLGPDSSVIVYTSANGYIQWGDNIETNTTDFNNKGVVAAFDKSGHTMWAQEIIADNVIPQQIAGSGNSVWLTGNAIDSTAFHFGSVTVTMPATAVDHYYPYAARLRISGTTTAVVEISKVKIAEVFPNPAYSQLGIKLPTNRTGQLFVSDMTGRKLLQAPLTTGMNTISVSDLARGSYIAEIVTDEGRQADILLLQ